MMFTLIRTRKKIINKYDPNKYTKNGLLPKYNISLLHINNFLQQPRFLRDKIFEYGH